MSRLGYFVLASSILSLSVACGRSGLDTGTSQKGHQWTFDGGGWTSDAGVHSDSSTTSEDASPDGPDTGSCGEASTPGAEICGNGIDEDCDGVADDGCACNYTGVADGVCQNGVRSQSDGRCLEPDFYEARETRCDGRDNDCNGLTDETCTCVEGETQPCYNGPAGTQTSGVCQPGVLACDGATFEGTCGGEVTPKPEECSGADEDCDGVVDEGCACTYDGTDTGVCAEALVDEFGGCSAPADYQQTEVSCDGVDNDCDGVVDENCACGYGGTSTGVCGAGSVSQVDGRCEPPSNYEADETSCDGIDNDCDGSTDENCACTDGESRSCYDGPEGSAGVGQCQAGQQSCVDGFFGSSCTGQVTPEAETCNGDDDDCDGVTDEGCACPYLGQSAGVCSQGVRDAGGSCTEPAAYEAQETTCDGLDNDCDGVTDEGCSCNYQNTAAGVCGDGVFDESGVCAAPASYEADETNCDGLDNDCDGATDEGCPCEFRNTSEGVCGAAVRNDGGHCKPPQGFTGREAHCDDGIDNDCNGSTDCNDPACARRGTCR